MEAAETLAEDLTQPLPNPADSPPPKARHQAAESSVSAEPTLAGSRRGRRRGARVSPDPAADEPMASLDHAVGEGDGRGSFLAGDLVWVRLRVRDWWPGVVLDPSSSEYAAEAKRRGSEDQPAVLVAPFGDAAVAWFEMPQLKPFGEGLPSMLRQSSSASLGRAVKEALVEVEKRLLSEMSCRCSPDEKYEATGGASKYSVTNYLPSEFYDSLLHASRSVLHADMLDVVLLRCWALALQSWRQSSTKLVSGMPSVSPTKLVDTDYSDVPLHDSATDEFGGDGEVNFSRAAKGPEISEVSKHKKERSIAELIAEGSEVTEPPDNGVKIATLDKSCLSSSSSESRKQINKGEKRKRSDVGDSTIDPADDKTVEFDRADPSSLSLAEKRNKSVKKQSSYMRNDCDLVELETRSSGRERKRSKYLSPPYAYEIRYVKRSFALNNEVAERSDTYSEASQSFSTTSSLDPASNCQVLKKEDDKVDAVSDGDRSSTNRILSAFLLAAVDPLHLKWNRSTNSVRDFFHKFRSSVYLNGTDFLSYDKFLNDSGNKCERPLDSSIDDDGKEKDKSAKKMNKPDNCVGNENPIDKDDDASFPTDPGKVQKKRKTRHRGTRDDITDTRENGAGTENDIREVNYSLEGEMSKARSDTAKDTIDIHHEFKNDTGGDKSRRKKRTDPSDAKSSLDTCTGLAASCQPNRSCSKRRKVKTEDSVERSEMDHKHSSASLEAGSKHKRNKKEKNNELNAVSLLLKFAPGTALPAKADIISRFSIYGPLVESQTDIIHDSHCIRVAFENDMDAKDAFTSLDSIGTLAPSIANYELLYPGTTSSEMQTSNVLKNPLPYIRKHLERMISKLTGFKDSEKDAQSSNSLGPEITDYLVVEMDCLLKKVNELLTGSSVTI